MNKITFTYGGKTFTRIDKRQARRFWEAGAPLLLVANKMRPFNVYDNAYTIAKKGEENETGAWTGNFDSFVNAFEYYNCDCERGKYTAFYRIEEATA